MRDPRDCTQEEFEHMELQQIPNTNNKFRTVWAPDYEFVNRLDSPNVYKFYVIRG